MGGAEPIGEIGVEVAVAVGATVRGAVASSEGSGVRLIGGVTIESGGGAIFNVDVASSAGAIGIVLNVVPADVEVAPAAA